MAAWLVDVALAIVAVELIVVAVARRNAGAPVRLALIANVAAGLALMVAVRLALADVAWPWLAAALMAAGMAHVADLALRRHGDSREQS